MIRTLTAQDDLELERVGYERGDTLVASTGRPDAHRYRVDTTSSLVADGLVLIDADTDAFRFLDTNRVPLTVRDLRRFRVLVKTAEASSTASGTSAAAAGPTTDVSAELVELRDDALDNDLVDGVDVAVRALGTTPGAECIVFDETPRGFVVGYRDGGSTTELFTSRSFAQARAVFLDEACWLGAGRGRGPYAGRDQAVGTEGWTTAQVVAAYERRLLDGS